MRQGGGPLCELGTGAAHLLPLIAPSQMRMFEQQVVENGDATVDELIERAGAAVVDTIGKVWPEYGPDADARGLAAVVLCGPGLNGADGFVVARLLRQRGWTVDVIGLGDQTALPPPAAAARQRFIDAGGEVHDASDPDAPFPGFFVDNLYDLAIDAIVGGRARQPLPWGWSETLYKYAGDAERLVCIDGHSEVDLKTGEGSIGCPADLTVTFHRPRPGHVLGAGPRASGRVIVAGIGLSNEWNHASSIGQHLDRDAPRLVVRPLTTFDHRLDKRRDHHKYDHGHALVLSGGWERAGAARLAARAALRTGAGLVTLAVPDPAAAPSGPDALMRRLIASPDDLAEALKDERINAVVIGPGLGIARARAMVEVALHAGKRLNPLGIVLDADALTAFADHPQDLFDLLRTTRAVLTPHAGEFARLFGPARPGDDPLSRVRSAASQAHAVVLHKGPTTIISDDLGAARVHCALDTPWLATAGAGDVLAGIIAGLLARGFPPLQAAATATVLHAAAARRFGPGLIADDLPDQLPGAFSDLGL